MKKFFKICLITVAIMLGLGVALLTIGGCGGGFKAARNMLLNGKFGIGFFDTTKSWSSDWAWNEDWDTYDLDEAEIFDHSYDIMRDQNSYSQTFSKEEVSGLKLELGGSIVKVGVSADENYHVSAENIDSFQTYVNGRTLYVKGIRTEAFDTWSDKWTEDSKNMRVTILIPEGTILDSAKLSLGAGDFTVESLNAKDIEMELGAGRLRIDSLQADTLECQIGAGQIIIKDGKVSSDATFEVGAGEFVYTGSINGNLDAECSLGNMEIVIVGSTEKDHNYEMECVAGKLSVGEYSSAGVLQEHQVNNNANSNFKLTCNMGNLSVKFK